MELFTVSSTPSPILSPALSIVMNELKGRGTGWLVTDEQFIIIAAYGDPSLFPECDSTALGRSLTDRVPELSGRAQMLRILMQGDSERLELANLRRQLSDRRTLHVRIVEIPYRTEQGEIAGLVHLVEDVSDVVALRQQLDAANYELNQGSDFFRVLAAIAAHQVGEPLTTIRGFVELLLDGAFGPLNEQQALQLRSVAQSALQLQQATVGIVGMLHAAANQVHLSLRPTDLGELVHEALATLEMKIHDKAIHVLYEVDRMLPRVMCDSDQTATLLHNLLRIGIECAAKTGRLEIRLAQTPDQKRVRLSMHCDSMNLTNADLQRIALPSVEVNRMMIGEWQSNVLELYLALNLLKLQNGEMAIQRVGEAGTLFVTLPIAQEKTKEKTQEKTQEKTKEKTKEKTQ